MRTLFVIGIGAGNPEHVTVQAVNAMNRVHVFFVIDKGQASRELVDLRTEICARYIEGGDYRIVQIPDVDRDRTSPVYRDAVLDWHEQRAVRCEQAIIDELGEHECGGFLVWGDPGLYDSTIRILERIGQRGRLPFDYQVVPGISSVQALAAGHRIVLNGIGEPILVTTGRGLEQALDCDAANIVVMLDRDLACGRLADPDTEIFWGAYLGTPDEVLVSGRVSGVIGEIREIRSRLKQQKGWIMDSYLLRRGSGQPTVES